MPGHCAGRDARHRCGPALEGTACIGGGRLTFESAGAIAAWRFTGNGGIDYDQTNFPPTHQARNGNEPVYVNNGWLRGTTGWHAMKRTLRNRNTFESMMMTPYLQGSTNLPPVLVSLIDPQTGAVLDERTVVVAAAGRYSEFYLSFRRPDVVLPAELIGRFGFWAPNADAWLRVGSVDIRQINGRIDCDSSGPLGKIW